MSHAVLAPLLFITGAIAYSGAALADESCDAALKPELLSRSLLQRSATGAAAARNWACSATLNELKNTSTSQDSPSGGGNLSVLNWFSIGGQGADPSSVSEEEFQRWKNQNCSQYSTDQNHSAFEYYAQQALGSHVIDNWLRCKSIQPSLTCWVSPKGQNQVEFHFVWHSDAIELPTVRNFTVTRGGERPQLLSQPGETVYIGEETKLIGRDPARDTFITLNIVREERFVNSCLGFVPHFVPPPPIAASQLVGKWCRQFGEAVRDWEIWDKPSSNSIVASVRGVFPGQPGPIDGLGELGAVNEEREFHAFSDTEFEMYGYNPFYSVDPSPNPSSKVLLGWLRYKLLSPSQMVLTQIREVDVSQGFPGRATGVIITNFPTRVTRFRCN